MKQIGILGSGTWGTALANLLASIGHKVTLWSKFPKEIEDIKSTHKHRNLPGVEIDERISFTSDIKEAVSNQDVIVMAVPSIFIRETAAIIRHQPDHWPMPRSIHRRRVLAMISAHAGSSKSMVSKGQIPARWEWCRWLSSSTTPRQSPISGPPSCHTTRGSASGSLSPQMQAAGSLSSTSCQKGSHGSPSVPAAAMRFSARRRMAASWKLEFAPQAFMAEPRYSGEMLTGSSNAPSSPRTSIS